MPLGERLKERRRARGLTQARLAEAARVSQGLIARIERGNVLDPAASIIRRLANALGVTADWLIGMNDDDPADASLLQPAGASP